MTGLTSSPGNAADFEDGGIAPVVGAIREPEAWIETALSADVFPRGGVPGQMLVSSPGVSLTDSPSIRPVRVPERTLKYPSWFSWTCSGGPEPPGSMRTSNRTDSPSVSQARLRR